MTYINILIIPNDSDYSKEKNSSVWGIKRMYERQSVYYI